MGLVGGLVDGQVVVQIFNWACNGYKHIPVGK